MRVSYKEPVTDVKEDENLVKSEVSCNWGHAFGEDPGSCCKAKGKPFELTGLSSKLEVKKVLVGRMCGDVEICTSEIYDCELAILFE